VRILGSGWIGPHEGKSLGPDPWAEADTPFFHSLNLRASMVHGPHSNKYR
jgi:hypothetical protein